MQEEAIFLAAIALTTDEERRAFLDRVCAGRPELQVEIEALLRASQRSPSFLEAPPPNLVPTLAVSDDGTQDDYDPFAPAQLPELTPCDRPGRLGLLDTYEVIELVGSGGMGVVLRAFDPKLNRVVAVKVMANELAVNASAVKRFLREARAAAAIVHDNVVTIHSINDTHRPPYIVMEFLAGQTLQNRLGDGPLDIEAILRIGSQTAAGLAAAHQLGLIHRDVKPGNILIEADEQRVKITDFGLARAADDVELTRAGMIAGTPQYMSPEQARGESIDYRSDLFSLGSVLYAACTGTTAFNAANTMGMLRRVCEAEPTPIRDINPLIPKWLCAIIDKLLAKDPADRYASASEVADLLHQCLLHVLEPSTHALPFAISTRRRLQRKTMLLSITCLLLLAATVPYVTFVVMQESPNPPEHQPHSSPLAEPSLSRNRIDDELHDIYDELRQLELKIDEGQAH